MGRKNVIFLLAIIFASSVLNGCIFIVSSGKNCKEYHREIQVSEPAEDISELQATSRNGHINVKGSSVDICDFKATITARTDDMARSKQLAEQTIVQLKRDSGVLRTDVQWPACESGENISVSFDIELPESVRLNLQTTNGKISASNITAPVSSKTHIGSIECNDISAALQAKTKNGRIALKNITGEKVIAETNIGSIKCYDVSAELQAETNNGSIELKNITGKKATAKTRIGSIKCYDVSAELQAETNNGGIEFKNVTADQITAKTHIGSIKCQDISGGLQAQTSNGRIEVDYGKVSGINNDTKIRTHIGSVSIKLPENYAADVHASTSIGRVHCDVDMNISRKSKTLIEGNIAGGTSKLDIMATNGSIHIK